jgi:hypothetical protein
MKISQLKNKLAMLEVTKKHELDLLELEYKLKMEELRIKHSQVKNELISSCIHKYDDGTSARETDGVQWDYWDKCGICGKVL